MLWMPRTTTCSVVDELQVAPMVHLVILVQTVFALLVPAYLAYSGLGHSLVASLRSGPLLSPLLWATGRPVAVLGYWLLHRMHAGSVSPLGRLPRVLTTIRVLAIPVGTAHTLARLGPPRAFVVADLLPLWPYWPLWLAGPLHNLHA